MKIRALHFEGMMLLLSLFLWVLLGYSRAFAASVPSIGVFRNGAWYLDVNANGQWDPGVDVTVESFGLGTDIPVVGDWNGDGTTDLGVFRNGAWYLDANGNGQWDPGVDRTVESFGLGTDVPVAVDWNGDGIAEIAVFRDGKFYVDANGDGLWDQDIDATLTYGLSTDAPLMGAWAIAGNEIPVERPTGSHAGRFSAFEGTKTCLSCHTEQALQVHASVHYQWKGDSSETIGLDPGDAGKLGGINDFCIYPDVNWIGKLTNVYGAQVDGGCAKCHAGLGEKPAAEPTQSQLENIDCLVCHSDAYRRKVEMVNGSFRFVPDTANMAVGILEAATDIILPSRDSCLNCHANAGGGNNYKRGDIEETHRDPPRNFDVHMASNASGGAGLSCVDCHTVNGHRIAGRGTDLRPRESNDEVSCARCHSETPHGNQDLDRHTARVNCTVCHIPSYARVAPTDMERDWSQPGELDPAKGLYEPSHVKGTNVIPQYRFFNGLSHFYQFGNPAVAGQSGRVAMSEPDGNIRDPNAKIYAFKRHLATQPMDPQTSQLLPLKIGQFFMTGQVAPAVELGVNAVGWLYSGHVFASTERYMGLFHEVAPREDALSCASCHEGGTRLDFAALGYTPNATYNGKALCASCHGSKTGSFMTIHDKHVRDRGYDCSVCHGFSSAN